MFYSLVRHARLTKAGSDWATANALVESFAIHVRNLIDFCYPTGQNDDIVAADFFDPPESWENAISVRSDLLKRAKKRADKEIAHLTYARLKVQPADKPWPVDDIDSELRPLIDAFCDKVPKALLGGLWATDPRVPDSGAPTAARGVTSTSSSL